MTIPHWDVLVVGAGPAGSSAATAAARQGASVLLVDRRRQVGLPVQCAGYIPAMLKGELDLGSAYVVQKIEGMHTYVPGQAPQKTAAPGYIIQRDVFDQTLVAAARETGAEFRSATRAIALHPEGHVTLSSGNGPAYFIHPRVIIGADGPCSTIGRWVGAVNRHLLPGVQMTLPLAAPLAHTEIYFDPDIRAGYGWVFPRGKVANVGLGMVPPSGGRPTVRNVLEGFIGRLEADGRIRGEPVAYAAGWIPAEPLRNAVHGKIMLAGDAAGHTHPITGAGIFAAVTCGRLAGKYAAAAVAANDMTLLKAYDCQWQELFGQTLARAHRRRKQMEADWSDFPASVNQCWVAFREYYDEI